MTARLPFTTPEAFAEAAGWSPRRVRKVARELGVCHILGNRMMLTEANVAVLLELPYSRGCYCGQHEPARPSRSRVPG